MIATLLLTALATCPDGQRLLIAVPALKASLSAGDVNALRRLGLPALPEGARIDGADIFRVRLVGPARSDLVVQVRARTEAGHHEAETWHYRIAALASLGKGAFCRLGGDLSADLSADVAPIEGEKPRTLEFRRVARADRDAILVRDVRAVPRAFEHDPEAAFGASTLQIWEVQGTALRRIFSTDTRSCCVLMDRSGRCSAVTRLRFSGAIPRRITTRTQDVCTLVSIKLEAWTEKLAARTKSYSFVDGAYRED